MAAKPNQEAIARLQASRAKSLKLMQLESSGAIDKIAKDKINEINTSLTDEGSVSSSMMTSIPSGASHQTRRMGAAASNVPSVIRESFQKTPPMDDGMLSLGDGKDLSFMTEGITPQQQVPRQSVREIIQESAPSMAQPSIDYPMIRNIVEETVRKYAQSLNKRIISESKGGVGEVNTIMLGKTFKFLDSKGNIYECTMKKVGNINNKKRDVEG